MNEGDGEDGRIPMLLIMPWKRQQVWFELQASRGGVTFCGDLGQLVAVA